MSNPILTAPAIFVIFFNSFSSRWVRAASYEQSSLGARWSSSLPVRVFSGDVVSLCTALTIILKQSVLPSSLKDQTWQWALLQLYELCYSWCIDMELSMLLGFLFEMDSFHALHVAVLGMFVTGFLCLALTPRMQLLHACWIADPNSRIVLWTVVLWSFPCWMQAKRRRARTPTPGEYLGVRGTCDIPVCLLWY